jgi:hypothetical protein
VKTISVAAGDFHWKREYFVLPVEAKSSFQRIPNSFSLLLGASSGREIHFRFHWRSFTHLYNKKIKRYPLT